MMLREPVPPGLGSWPEAAGVAFRVWAPNASAVAVRLVDGALAGQDAAMAAEPGGYWSAEVAGAAVGDGYLYMVTWEGQALERIDPYARRVTNSVAPGLAPCSSRVSMLRELSHSTAIVGFCCGLNCSTHSGWLNRTTARIAIASRNSSIAP